MNLFKDFEVKPLSEGLGFHDKSVKLKEQVRASRIVEENLFKTIPAVPRSLITEDKKFELTTPLPRETHKVLKSNTSSPMTQTTTSKVDVNKLFPSGTAKLDYAENKRVAFGNNKKKTAVKVEWSLSAAFLDGIVTTAIFLIFLMSVLAITKVDLVKGLASATFDPIIYANLGLMYVFVLFTYMLLARTYFGKSLGEWAFDLKLGRDSEIGQVSYPLKVLLRLFIIFASGMVLIPVVSIIMRKDIAGYLTGLRLYNSEQN